MKSNQLNKLGNQLIKIIKERNNIFKPITVVVPHYKVSQWFKAYWLKNEQNVLMNVKFETINNILLNFIKAEKECRLISKEQIRTLIIKILSKDYNIDIYKEFKQYIIKENELDPIKLYDLANALASLFVDYEQDQFEITGAQEVLYDSVFKEALNHNLSSAAYQLNNNCSIKKEDEEIYFFGFVEMTKLQEFFINKLNASDNNHLLFLEKDNTYKKEFDIIAVPSKLREIEVVHSTICDLLKDPNNKFEDFLVVSSDISQYEDVIPRVFRQASSTFPSIPFVINDSKKLDTNISTGLLKLLEIANKGFFTRLDFYFLISNSDVQSARNITSIEVEVWSKYLVDTNIYRNSEEKDDWDYAKKRIILSKISNINDIDDNLVDINGRDYIPYAKIDFDDESINKFVNVIDDLNNWIKITKDNKYIRFEFDENDNIIEDSLTSIFYELTKWFSIKDLNGFEKNKYFKNIFFDIHFWKTIKVNSNVIPLNVLLYSLIDSSKITKAKTGDYFLKGITFADFDAASILSAKYIFFLNASSKELPIPVVKSELDLRDYEINNNEKLENAFLLQYQNASSKFYISYVNSDLKNDEPYYPSSFVIELKKDNKFKEKEISIDEKRNWSELYTEMSFENKDYYNGLFSSVDDDVVTSETYDVEPVLKVKLKDLSDYLEEPLMHKTKMLFGRDNSVDEDIKEEFEPLVLNKLSIDTLVKKISIDALKNNKEMKEENFIELKEKFELDNKLPIVNEDIKKLAFTEVFSLSQKLVDYIRDKSSKTYEFDKLNDVPLKVDNKQIKIICNEAVYVSIDGEKRTYFQVKQMKEKPDNKDEKQFLYLYVYSLMDILRFSESSGDITFNITLDRGKDTTRNFEITPNNAEELLKNIYRAKTNYSDNAYLPLNKFYTKDFPTLNKMIEDLISQDGSPWGYFDHKKIFNYETQLGYTYNNFKKEYLNKRNKHISLIKYLKPIDDEKEGEVDEKK